MSDKVKLIRFAHLLLADEKYSKIASKEDRVLLAKTIIKSAIDRGSFSAIGPYIAQQFALGASGEYGMEALKADPKKYALLSLVKMFGYQSRIEAQQALTTLEKAMTKKLEVLHSQLASRLGENALETAYQKLLLESIALKKGSQLDNSSLKTLELSMGGMLGSIVRGDAIDSVKVDKNRARLEREKGVLLDSIPSSEGDSGSTDLLSRDPSAKLTQKAIQAISGLIDTATINGEISVQQAMKTLRVESQNSAKLFMNAVVGCGVFDTASKYSTELREDVLAVYLLLPHAFKIKGSRNEKIIDTRRRFLDMFQNSSDMAGDVRNIFRGVGYVPSKPASLYGAIDEMSVKSINNYMDQAFLVLLNKMIKMDMGIEDGISNKCLGALAVISDKSQLAKFRSMFKPKGVDYTRV